jgi:glycosyltransferase involved in cell wall biosynthesis
MPSLVEGFGHVYLEALAAGTFVIGTSNSGLPDLSCPSDSAIVLPPGDLNPLEEALVRVHRLIREGEVDRSRIASYARFWGWERFRADLRLALDQSTGD